MMNKLKKMLAAALVFCITMGLAACSDKTALSDNDKPTVRIALCTQAMLENIPIVIRDKFPDINFEFTLAQNSIDYYEYLSEHDDLPDIITVRRFSLLDAVDMKDELVDLSKTDLAASYYQNYLQNYTYDDGTVNWLPALAEVWCIVANKSLFEEYDITIPYDYDSFVSACESFEELGIQGFLTDWKYDYSSLETLEGFNIEGLQSLDGKKWRTDYESGVTTTLDDEVWAEAFDHMEEVLEVTGNIADNEAEAEELLECDFDTVKSKMESRQVAMIRSSGDEVVGYNERNDDEYIILPYFGETKEENWLLTYPDYQAAINANSDVDADLLMEIYTYMYSQEAQDALGLGSDMLSYTTEVDVEMNEYLAELSEYLDNNRIFIRLANNSFFTASQAAVCGMISGEYDSDSARELFNETLIAEAEEPQMDLYIEEGYEYEFDPEHGSQSSSAVLNSCRYVWGTELAATYAPFVSNSIYEGEASTSEVKYYLGGTVGKNHYLELTGAEVKSLIGTMVCYEPGEQNYYNGVIPVDDSMLPVVSGCEISVATKEDGTGYEFVDITINGEELDEDKVYTMVFSVPIYYASYIAEQAGIEIPEGSNKVLPSMEESLKSYLVENGAFMEPTDYIKLDK